MGIAPTTSASGWPRNSHPVMDSTIHKAKSPSGPSTATSVTVSAAGNPNPAQASKAAPAAIIKPYVSQRVTSI